MITGATRGAGFGGALARHLLKAENGAVVIPARGLGSANLSDQVQELVAMSAGGRTDRPLYHVYCSPDPAIADDPAVRKRFWLLFEDEFGMTAHPYCGVEHRKDGRLHEHRVYSLVRPCGSVVDLSWDYLRREKCGRIVEHEFGMQAVPSKHARSIAKRLRQEGRHDVADWLVASGTTESDRPVARLTPRERLIEERTGIALDDVRSAALVVARRGGTARPVVVPGCAGRSPAATRRVPTSCRAVAVRPIVATLRSARSSSGLPALFSGLAGHRGPASMRGPRSMEATNR